MESLMRECGCPGTYPDWDGQDVDLSGWMTHMMSIPMFLHMPLAYEAYLERQRQEIAAFNLKEHWPGLILTCTGWLRGSIRCLLEPETSSPSRHVKSLPPSFNVRVALHHGNVSTMRKQVAAMQESLFSSAYMPKELYIAHLTCPKCQDKCGGEQILLLRRWEISPMLLRRKGKKN